MMKTNDLLNAVTKKIISMSNAKGVDLKAEFGTVANFQKFIFSLTVRTIMDVMNVNLEEAYNLVMGVGSYKALADEILEINQA
jgi:hypothetical protein